MTDYKKEADGHFDHMYKKISGLANQRIGELVAVFRKRFPKRTLRILNGQGVDVVWIDGRAVNFYYGTTPRWTSKSGGDIDVECLMFMDEALDEIDSFTNSHKHGSFDEVRSFPLAWCFMCKRRDTTSWMEFVTRRTGDVCPKCSSVYDAEGERWKAS